MTAHSTFRRDRRRPLSRGAAAILPLFSLFLLTLPAAAGPAGADCPSAGMADIRISYIDLDSDGIPDVESSDKERNERARISSSLASKLGISSPVDPEVFPQIRVIAQNQDLASGDPAMGVFSVFEVYTSGTDEIQVYADEDSSDDESGEYRLFEDVTVADLSAVRLTAYPQAVSSTTMTAGGGTPAVTEHYCESSSYSRFTEAAVLETDTRFALLVPHGGEIEAGTSEQVGPIASTLASSWGIWASSWDVQGYWHDDRDESEHWHITSDEVTSAGFPGLAALEGAPAFDGERQFRYVASLHGMKYSQEGMILGGRASREAKCLIAGRVRERMAAEGLPVPAVYIYNYDKDEDLSIELEHGGGGPKITAERGDPPGVSGTSRDNIVNRLSPNEDGAPGFGGIQIEQSPKLRDDEPLPQFEPATVSYRDLVAEEIAHAFGELLAKPGIVSPGSTAICDALEAGVPAPTAEIRGRVWRDLDGDHARGASDPAVAAVEVELLDGSGSPLGSTLSDAEGRYAFSGLAAGSYRVRIQLSSVFELADKDQAGGDDTLDSDLDPGTGATDLLTLAAHDLADHVDAGVAPADGTASLGDLAWVDADGNGVQDALEDGLSGIAVTLLDEGGLTVATTVTDGGGLYSFTDLAAGSYRLRFAPEAGYEPVTPGQGGDPSRDSDIDSSFEAQVVLGAGAQDLTVDAGFAVNCHDATVIAFGSVWSWSTVESAGWNETSFVEDGDWSRAQGSLGYGLALESVIAEGGDVAYFRIPFEVENPSLFDDLDLLLIHDDGAVVYLNGEETLTSNVPLAGSGTVTVGTTVPGSGLVEGTNVLAVEVHEGDGTLAFDLELSARVCRPCVASEVLTADRVTYIRDGSSKVRGNEATAKMDADTQESSLLAWPVESLPADAEVLHAEIRWRVIDDSSDTFHLYPLLQAWNEGSAHWFRRSGSPTVAWAQSGANDPDLDHQGDEPLASIRFTDDPPFTDPPYTGRIVLNLSGREWVQGWVRGERPNNGILIPGEGSGSKLEVDSDDGTQPPVLEVVYRSCTP
jgi:phage replication-related protein YjqB (UPF0714/DUF867 family)